MSAPRLQDRRCVPVGKDTLPLDATRVRQLLGREALGEILDAGRDFSLGLVGLNAMDCLRLEKAYRLGNALIGLVVLVVGSIALLGALFARPIVALMLVGFTTSCREGDTTMVEVQRMTAADVDTIMNEERQFRLDRVEKAEVITAP